MRFASPHLLWLLAVPAVLAAAYAVAQRRRTAYAVRLTTLDLLDDVAPDRPGWRRHLPAAALLLALLALVIALARPVEAREVPVELATVVVALDTSISMAARDVQPSRLDAATDAALAFVDQVPEQVRLGLVEFAETAVPVVAPTPDKDQVRAAIQSLTLRPGTAIGDALVSAVDLVQRDLQVLGATDLQDVPATIVVLSDGETTVGRPDAVGVAAAQDAGIPVSTISFGTLAGQIVFGGEIVPVPANGAALQAIAEATGGVFFDAENAGELSQAFAELGSAVGTTTEDVEVTGRFLAAALVLGTAAGAGSLRWFQRLP